jgi:hypothetical protein
VGSAFSGTSHVNLDGASWHPRRVDDATALRLKKIEMSLESARRSAELQSHRAIAILAIGATFGASASLAGLAGQLHPWMGAASFAAAATVVLFQLRSLQRLARSMPASNAVAMAAIDTLITTGGESDADGEADS